MTLTEQERLRDGIIFGSDWPRHFRSDSILMR